MGTNYGRGIIKQIEQLTLENERLVCENERQRTEIRDLRPQLTAFEAIMEETASKLAAGINRLEAQINKKFDEMREIKNKPLARTFKKINPKELEAYVSGHPDAYLSEIAEKFDCWPSAVE